jgi:hypothetical protein
MLAVMLTVSSSAMASSDTFNFVFTDGNVSGSGTLYGTVEDSGSWLLTGGSGTFNDGASSGAIHLIVNSSGPGNAVVSPSGYFAYDNQLFPFFSTSQLIDEDGLLFSFNGGELNLWQGGNSPGRGGWAENNGSGDLNGTFTITSYSLQQPPSLTISGIPVTVSRGSTTANASSVTVTPVGGFAGNVLLTAAITSSPAGAQYPPTLSFGSTNLVTLTSASAVSATLTVATTAASSAQATPTRPIPWYSTGSMALACILLIGIPARRRHWQKVLGILVILTALSGGLFACGGGGTATSNGGGGGNNTNSGTTAGTYTITVTGSYGQFTSTSSIPLHVL